MRASGIAWLCLALTLTAARAEDSPWTSRDYVDFYFRHYNGHVPLPHLRDEAQKALFKHLIDPGNITRIAQTSVSNDEKLRQLRIILAVLGSYRAAYNVAVIVGEPLQQELTLSKSTHWKLLLPLQSWCTCHTPMKAPPPPGPRWLRALLNRLATASAIHPSSAPSWRMPSPCTIPPSPRFFPGMKATAWMKRSNG